MERQSRSSFRRWLSSAFLIAAPCFLALTTYDWIAVFLIDREIDHLSRSSVLGQDFLQDASLIAVYAILITPRVSHVVAEYRSDIRRVCLIMVGLGLAWYEVVCASLTRLLPKPPGFWVTVVILFVIPMVLAPWYVRWLRQKMREE